jgi:DNA-binding CsgD family transcriptional regulator
MIEATTNACAPCAPATNLRQNGRKKILGKPLTERQKQVVMMIAKSFTPREIADIMQLKRTTVYEYRMSISKRLGYKDIASLTRYAIRTGLITAEE